jgi:phospholipase A1/A2
MRRLLNRCGCLPYHRQLVSAIICMTLPFVFAVKVNADVPKGIDECAKIEDSAERLKCYDELAGRKELPGKTPSAAVSETKPGRQAHVSYLERLWELDKKTRKDRYVISPHRSTYLLPVTYVESPNEQPIKKSNPDMDLKNTEAAFQFSFKTKIWQDILGENMDLWVAYTQRSFWQSYNFKDSAPFRETNYEPEIILNFRTSYDLLWLKGRFINVGLNHQSNGQSGLLSRSWNRAVANFGFERDNLVLILKTWYRFPESAENDNNSDINNYLGYGELWGYYFWNGNRFGVMARNNLNAGTNRSAVQLEWSFPLLERISGYIQYFNGYGESMLDYDHNINRIGIGFILRDWE